MLDTQDMCFIGLVLSMIGWSYTGIQFFSGPRPEEYDPIESKKARKFYDR